MKSFNILKEYLPLLSHGSSNSDYPPFSRYIYSDGKYIHTYNNSVYVRVKLILPFTGFVNIYILTDILNKMDAGELQCSIDNRVLKLYDNSFKSNLNIEAFNPPDYSLVVSRLDDLKFIKVDDDLLDSLKTGVKFSSPADPDKMYVIVRDGETFSTNGGMAFYYEKNYDIKDAVFVNSKILSILDDSCEIATMDYYTIVKSGDILFIFILNKISWSLSTIRNMYEKCYDNLEYICDFADLKNAVSRLNSLSYGEQEFYVNLDITPGMITVSYSSAINGSASVSTKSETVAEKNLIINGQFLKKISVSDYKVYLSDGLKDGIVLHNDKYFSFIIGKEIK